MSHTIFLIFTELHFWFSTGECQDGEHMTFSGYYKRKTQQSFRENQLYYGIFIFNGTILRLALTRRKIVIDVTLQGSATDQLFRDLYGRSTPPNISGIYLRIFQEIEQARRRNYNVSITDWYMRPYSYRFCSVAHGIYYSTGTWRMFTFPGH